MDTATFLARVLAPRDNIVIAALKPGLTGDKKDAIFWNTGNFATPQEAADESARLDADPNITAYFAVGVHANNQAPRANGKGIKTSRKQETATWFKALCFDLDIGQDKGSPYNTQREGMAALIAALKTFAFPPPMVVNSGKGIHCYWPLVDEIDRDRWVRLSKALRLALRDGQVVIDESKIHDASMVLRPVGSHHKKATPWVEVKVVADCPDYHADDLEGRLAQWIGLALPAKGKSAGAVATTKIVKSSAISDAILKGGYEPINLAAVGTKCLQLAAIVASGGATDAMGLKISEPLWRGTLGVAAYCVDQMAAVIALCSKHPDFDLQYNMNKLANWKGTGVTTCAYFEQHCANGCNGCPSKGQINSPAALNQLTELIVTDVETDEETGEATPGIFQLPPGYFASMNKIWTEVETEKVVKDANGDKNKVTVMEKQIVCCYPLVVLDRFTDVEDYSKTTLRWAVKHPMTGWKLFEMPMEVLAKGGTELTTFLWNKQVTIPDAQLPRTRTYVRNFVEFIEQTTPTGRDIGSFGWQPDGSFLCGNKLTANSGANMQWRALPTLRTLSLRVRSRGNKAHWIGMTSLLDKPCAQHIAFATLVAGSGLIIDGAGIESYVYSMHSPGTGTGKTLALLFGNSLFGHPNELLLQPSDTDNAIMQVMGGLGNLSASMDEITTMGPERAAKFAFSAQTGREKIRLNQNSEMRDGVKWSAPLRVTTNTSLYYLYDLYRSKNEAEKVRTMEMLIDDKEFVNTHDVLALTHELRENHGFAITDIAEEIINRGGVRKVYDQAAADFAVAFPHFKFTGDERFFSGGVISAYGIGCIGRDLGLFQFSPENCVQWALERIEELRRIRAGAVMDGFDVIGQFLAEFNNQLVVIKHEVGSSSKPVAQMPIPDLAVARMELNVDKKGTIMPNSKLMINTVRLREWAKKARDDINNTIYELRKQGGVIAERERVSIYKGTQHNNPGQAQCLVLDLLHPRFAAVLTSNNSILATNPALAVIQGGKP